MNWSFGIVVAMLFFLGHDALAQKEKKSGYIVVIKHKDGSSTKGLLDKISPEGIDVINFHDSIVHIVVPSEEVVSIQYRKEGKIKRHLIYGLLIGAGAGLGVGLLTYEAHPCGFGATCVEKGIDPLTTTMIGGIAGAGAGALLGSRYERIEIEGDPKKYEAAVSFFENP